MSKEIIKVKICTSDLGSAKYGKSEPRWYLKRIETENSRSLEPVMGWTSTNSSDYQLKIRFCDQNSAISYAKKQGYEYVVQEPKEVKIRKKSYTENFI